VDSLWSIIAKPKNRQIVSWIGGRVIVVATYVWAVVTYVWPAHESEKVVCAQEGSVASGRDVSGNSITYNGGAPSRAGSGATSCADTVEK
jgi:hypothetical protein